MSIPTRGAGGSAAVDAPHFKDLFVDTPNSHLDLHAPDISVGNGWQNLAQHFHITAGGIVAEAAVNNAMVWNDTGSVCKRVFIDWRNILDAQLIRCCWRVADVNNFLMIEMFTFGNTYWVKKKVAGVVTPLWQATPTIANTTWYTAWIYDNGNDIAVYHAAQGSPRPGTPLITGQETDLAANTGVGMHGLWAQQRYDNLYAYPK
jgi:hypothetical protein